jgi:hypothetical protein
VCLHLPEQKTSEGLHRSYTKSIDTACEADYSQAHSPRCFLPCNRQEHHDAEGDDLLAVHAFSCRKVPPYATRFPPEATASRAHLTPLRPGISRRQRCCREERRKEEPVNACPRITLVAALLLTGLGLTGWADTTVTHFTVKGDTAIAEFRSN